MVCFSFKWSRQGSVVLQSDDMVQLGRMCVTLSLSSTLLLSDQLRDHMLLRSLSTLLKTFITFVSKWAYSIWVKVLPPATLAALVTVLYFIALLQNKVYHKDKRTQTDSAEFSKSYEPGTATGTTVIKHTDLNHSGLSLWNCFENYYINKDWYIFVRYKLFIGHVSWSYSVLFCIGFIAYLCIYYYPGIKL